MYFVMWIWDCTYLSEMCSRVSCSAHQPILNHTMSTKKKGTTFKFNIIFHIAKTGHGPHSPRLGDNFYAVSISLIPVWPLWVRIPESLPTKVVNCVVLYIVCVWLCTVLLPPGVNPIAVNKVQRTNCHNKERQGGRSRTVTLTTMNFLCHLSCYNK